ncbi:related to conserved hypothetical Ustilaginaceae-specific protein [Ustilago trichophora]|uniref:Related to conserved hypothetical Ustilaginaceae-specific protein n=1 Tax=Ustilago trichophora TaxID=86804 RepID=A0A5C3ENX8_9BASI|nr:related to conserved hypothetical Ustilaginaceae-specific protein [Ustilago trichophora]
MQSSAMARLNKMNVNGRTPSSLPSSSSSSTTLLPTSTLTVPHTTTASTSSTTRTLEPTTKPSSSTFLPAPLHRTGTHDQPAPSTPGATSSVYLSAPSSSSSAKPAFEYEDYSSFFDDYASKESATVNRPEADIRESTFVPLQLNFQGTSDDDEEDLKDLSALNFTKSIRMNLEALSRGSADHYAYNADGYADPNVHYQAKAVEDAHDATWFENSYAHLISKLSLAQDGSVTTKAERRRHHVRSYERSQDDQEQGTPQTSSSSSKDSPPAASLASGRSSSDAHEDELRTPPEPSLERFDPAVESPIYDSAPRRPARRSPLPSQEALPAAAAAADAAPQLGSPFQPSRPPAQQSQRSLHRPETQEAFGRYDIGDSSELELLSDDVNAQRRAAGKARMMPWHNDASSSQGHGRRRSSPVYDVVESNKPFTRLGPQDIAFSATTLPELRFTASDCVGIITARYPALCDAPLREFGEDGQPLPPTKKQETSEEERQARRDALRVKFCAKQRLSLIKAMVVMESRSASWKRIGPFNVENTNVNTASEQQLQQEASPRTPSEVARLPPMPSPWSMEIRHEQLDVAQIKGKSKKTIELGSLRINARCVKCDGSGLGSCITCRAEKADECFWCSGTGREKTRAQAWCRRCQGAGVLKCNTCHGSLKSDCRSCEGTGTGEYGFFVDVTVKRVEMPAVPISTLFPNFNPASTAFEPSYDEVKTAATLALWDSITKLTEARSQATSMKGGKGKSKEMVPVMAACVWENSISHVVAIDVPLAAKFKKGAVPALRPEGLHRKIPTKRRFFTVPNDADLRSAELTEDEVKQIAAPRPPVGQVYQHHPRSPAASSAQSQTTLDSPYQSSVDFGFNPPLATPSEGASVSGFSTPTRVPSPRSDAPPAKPAAREFVHRPSPLSQLTAATTPSSASPSSVMHQHQQREHRQDYLDSQEYLASPPQHLDSPESQKSRRPSAGQVLTKKLSSNILNKLGAHRGSF